MPQPTSPNPLLPTLRKSGHRSQLHLAGQPFLVLGGELGNSTASHLPTLQAALARCRRMHLNTVLLPVYWDLIEPAEGAFDFSLVQGAIDQARAEGLKLIYLWFGTWKNSMSCYAPSWVKRNTARFPRARRRSGEPLEIISPASTEARAADAKAFAALMRFTRTYDTPTHTVIMTQVENEIGMIPDPRDYSDLSERAYHAPVPSSLANLAATGQLGPEVTALWQSTGQRATGTWPELFGTTPHAEELFSAHQFATYVENVTAAGKAEHPLPMFTNAALIRPNYLPGQYPSAGPLPHLLEIYRAAAPSLDMICPDIYFPNFIEWATQYTRNHNPLFIPEMAASLRMSANIAYAIAQLGAIGCGPFSIENLSEEKELQLTSLYAHLESLAPKIVAAQQTGQIIGLSPIVNFDWSADLTPQSASLGNITFTATFHRPSTGGDTSTTTLPTLGAGRWDVPPEIPLGAALILQLADEEFLILAMATTLTYAPKSGQGKIGLDQVQQGHLTPTGDWQGDLILNGDQTHQGRHTQHPNTHWTVQKVKLYHYQ